MELKFDAKAIADLDCAAAIVVIKASARRVSPSLSGAGSAQPSRLIAIMHAKKSREEAPTSTQELRRVLDKLYRADPKRLAAKEASTDPA